MFSRLEITIGRAAFWLVSVASYWGLVSLAWWNTRVHLYLGAQIVAQMAERKGLSAIMANLAAHKNAALVELAQTPSLPGVFLLVPLVMTVVLVLVPFVVRKDYSEPLRGVFLLPATVLLTYFFAGLFNLVLAAACSAALHYYLFLRPGPDFFLYLVQPLYLIYPLWRSVPAFLSQCLYLAFIVSVLTAPSVQTSAADDTDEVLEEEDDDWDKSACIMEIDRLCRLIGAKFEQPALVHAIRAEVSDYVNRPSQVKRDVQLGIPHYQIVLTEAKNALRRMIEEGRERPRSHEVFAYIIDEMKRMEYITPEGANESMKWLADLPARKG